MAQPISVDMQRFSVAISRDMRMTPVANKRGPPPLADGFVVGLADLTQDPPHRGERHPDGDELVLVVSGRATVTLESAPAAPLELGPGEACVIPMGEWHRIHPIEPTRLVYITPGPRSEHRPLQQPKG